MMTLVNEWIEVATMGFELLAVVVMIGFIVLGTVLGWTLTVEVEGRWPWQAERSGAVDEKSDARAC